MFLDKKKLKNLGYTVSQLPNFVKHLPKFWLLWEKIAWLRGVNNYSMQNAIKCKIVFELQRNWKHLHTYVFNFSVYLNWKLERMNDGRHNVTNSNVHNNSEYKQLNYRVSDSYSSSPSSSFSFKIQIFPPRMALAGDDCFPHVSFLHHMLLHSQQASSYHP